jgi:acyl-CoA synthetase (AMP-forming)/AMP-acid ligase II
MGGSVIVKRQKGNLTEKGIIRFCSDKLAKYKVPKYVSFVSILPKTSLGKTKKYLLKEQFVKNTPHEQT